MSAASTLDTPASAPRSPLRRLLQFAAAYRRDVRWAVTFSVLNKFFDVLPELLIGVAVDVVVNRTDSFLARQGLVDPTHQLYALVALTVLVWVSESICEYQYAAGGGSPRACSTISDRTPTDTSSACCRATSNGSAAGGSWPCSTRT